MAIVRVDQARQVTKTEIEPPATWDVGTFSQDKIDQALAMVAGWMKFAFPADPDLIPVFWPMPDKLPTLDGLDFGHPAIANVDVTALQASQTWIKVDRLYWHIANPGCRLNTNPFTTMPVVLDDPGGPIIVDGHHTLGALLLLGADPPPVWVLPPKN